MSAKMEDDGGLVGKDADHTGSAFDLLVDPFQRVGRPHLGPVVAREGGEGEHFGLRLIHQWPDLGEGCGELAALSQMAASGWAKSS
jgi:hypothetical protein